LRHQAIAASQLWIAERSDTHTGGFAASKASSYACAGTRLIVIRAATIYLRTDSVVGVQRGRAVEEATGLKGARARVESVVVFRRPEKIVVEAGLRRERQFGRQRVIRIQFDRVVLGLVDGIERGFDHAQIGGLGGAGIGIEMDGRVDRNADPRQWRVIWKRYAVGNLKRFRRIKRRRKAALTQVVIGLIGGNAVIPVVDDPSIYLVRYRRRLAQLLGCAHAVVVFGEVLPHHIDLQPLDGLQAQRDAARPEIATIDALLREIVERIALTLRPFAGDAQVDAIVDDRKVDHAFEALLVIRTDFAGRHRFELIAGSCGGEVHHARRRVAAVKRALRSAQDFVLREIVEFLFEEMIAQERNVVQRNRDGRIGGD